MFLNLLKTNKKILILLFISISVLIGLSFFYEKDEYFESENITVENLSETENKHELNSNDDTKDSFGSVVSEKNTPEQEYIDNINFFSGISRGLGGFDVGIIFDLMEKVEEAENNKPKIIKVPDEYKSIQLAIDNAKFGDRVEVGEGEYRENIIMKDRVSLIGSNKLVILENEKFEEEKIEEKESDSEASESDSFSSVRQIIINETIIDGGNSGNVISFKNGITDKTELTGFTIKNSGKSLSGIMIENSSPWIHDNIIIDNEYGIYIKDDSFPIIQKNVIHFANKGIQVYNFEEQNGFAQEYGANDMKPIMIDNLITDNKIGIDLYQSSALIEHNTISYNNHYKTYLGATHGIYLSKSSAEITSNIITDSGICELCTGVSADEDSKDVILSYNNIWNNKNNFVCFGKCVMEENNMSEDPMFVDYINGDYTLSEESGLIGMGKDEINIGVRWE